VLKIKLSHDSMAALLAECSCKHGGGGTFGRVQWDPARDLHSAEGNEPRKMLRRRAIQIGIKGHLSELYVSSVLSIEDVTALAHEVGRAHQALCSRGGMRRRDRGEQGKGPQSGSMEGLSLPVERDYLPRCSNCTLERLGMLPGQTAEAVSGLGRGKVGTAGGRTSI
jgi:hypothetical protein